jgi:glutamine synthetase adenylyltransferase
LQALTRVRPIAGPEQEDFIALAKDVWRAAGERTDLLPKIDNMLDRVRRERGSGAEFLDFKTGTGGMIEAEFLVQALQMRAGIWNPNWHSGLSMLRKGAVITASDADPAAKAYELLRRCELTLGRFENKSVACLPADSNEQHKLAKRLGYKDASVFTSAYGNARETIHAIYERYIKHAPA